MVAASVGSSACSALDVRTTREKWSSGSWSKATYIVGQVVVSSAPSLMSSTTPTTSLGGCEDVGAETICLPTGFSPGKYLSASARSIMTTGGFEASSASVK